MGAKPSALFIRACSTGKTDIVRQLLQEGLSPEATDTYGLTGLIWAGRKGQVDIAKLLVGGGADLDAKDRTGRTAFFHAVVFNRHDFVEYVAAQGSSVNPVDMHGCTPLDLARIVENVKKSELDRMVDLLVRLGGKRKKFPEPPSPENKKWNRFFLNGIEGGSELPIGVDRSHMQLRRLFGQWTGNYTQAVEDIYFTQFVDGSGFRHKEQIQLIGPGKPHRSHGALTVKIGIPESWWNRGEPTYKGLLAGAIEEGLRSMIALLQRNKYAVDAERWLADWAGVKQRFLETPAPPFAAENQKALLIVDG